MEYSLWGTVRQYAELLNNHITVINVLYLVNFVHSNIERNSKSYERLNSNFLLVNVELKVLYQSCRFQFGNELCYIAVDILNVGVKTEGAVYHGVQILIMFYHSIALILLLIVEDSFGRLVSDWNL
jgi:hypothetical protein